MASDTDGDGNPDVISVPGWGNPNEDMHTVKSTAIYGQATYELNDRHPLVVCVSMMTKPLQATLSIGKMT